MSTLLRLPVQDLDFVVGSVGARWEQLRNKKIFLTGGTGFIGKWMLATFLYANRQLNLSANIVVLSRNPEAFLQDFTELRNYHEVHWVKGDVRSLSGDSVGDSSYVIHAATDVVASSTPTDILTTCVEGTRRVIDVVGDGSSLKRLLLLSSGAIYGRIPPNVPFVSEDWNGAPDTLAPNSAYGEGKRVSELLCSIAASAQPNLQVAIARCFAFVGPHLPFDKHFAIGNFIASAMRNEDIYIQGDGTPLRSYLYAADLARWLWTMLFEAQSQRAYNIGGPESLSIAELAHRVNLVVGGRGKVRIARPAPIGVAPQVYVPSIERISTELNLIPSIGLDESIQRTAAWASSINKL